MFVPGNVQHRFLFLHGPQGRQQCKIIGRAAIGIRRAHAIGFNRRKELRHFILPDYETVPRSRVGKAGYRGDVPRAGTCHGRESSARINPDAADFFFGKEWRRSLIAGTRGVFRALRRLWNALAYTVPYAQCP